MGGESHCSGGGTSWKANLSTGLESVLATTSSRSRTLKLGCSSSSTERPTGSNTDRDSELEATKVPLLFVNHSSDVNSTQLKDIGLFG
eukprot:jgi/Botrbrau1/1143/Bobra.0162s0034.1